MRVVVLIENILFFVMLSYLVFDFFQDLTKKNQYWNEKYLFPFQSSTIEFIAPSEYMLRPPQVNLLHLLLFIFFQIDFLLKFYQTFGIFMTYRLTLRNTADCKVTKRLYIYYNCYGTQSSFNLINWNISVKEPKYGSRFSTVIFLFWPFTIFFPIVWAPSFSVITLWFYWPVFTGGDKVSNSQPLDSRQEPVLTP